MFTRLTFDELFLNEYFERPRSIDILSPLVNPSKSESSSSVTSDILKSTYDVVLWFEFLDLIKCAKFEANL